MSIDNIGYRTYVYFCIFNFFFIPLIYFFYPETRKLSLEQIDKLFTGEKITLHWRASMGDVRGEIEGDSAGQASGGATSLEGEKRNVETLEAGNSRG